MKIDNVIIKQFSLLLIGVLASFCSTAATISSAGTGNWETGGTWVGGAVPVAGDVITIEAGHVVTVTTNNATLNGAATDLYIEGTLDFGNGDKLQLGCGSGIKVQAGGLISAAGSGNGASNNIKICGAEVWRKSEGDVTGPESFGEPLPVELLNFEVVVSGNKAIIEWSTASELNNDYFEILKSTNGLTFYPITKVAGMGTTNKTSYYNFEDELSEGVFYYKLSQTDYDGAYEQFKIVAVEKNTISNENCVITVYPNPCPGNCKVKLKDCPLENSTIKMLLVDAGGVAISSIVKDVDFNGEFDLSIDRTNNLKPGVYILSGEVGSSRKNTRIVVQ